MGKTRGMGAGRKLKTHRRNQRWADKSYKKSHLGNEWKKPFAGSSHAKGIVLEKIHNLVFTLTRVSRNALETQGKGKSICSAYKMKLGGDKVFRVRIPIKAARRQSSDGCPKDTM
ncbi:hypothetical protein ACFE04_002152 [Oxalis oulophora]